MLLVDLGRAPAEAEPKLEPAQFVDKRLEVIFSIDRPGPAKSHLYLYCKSEAGTCRRAPGCDWQVAAAGSLMGSPAIAESIPRACTKIGSDRLQVADNPLSCKQLFDAQSLICQSFLYD
jgi:hypothetical protein